MPIYKSLAEATMAMRPQNGPRGTEYQDHSQEYDLKPIQKAQYDFYESQVEQYGQYDQGIGANGAHYGPNSPFSEEGLVCSNCVFYGENACEIVQGQIAPGGICKFWIIPESKLNQ